MFLQCYSVGAYLGTIFTCIYISASAVVAKRDRQGDLEVTKIKNVE